MGIAPGLTQQELDPAAALDQSKEITLIVADRFHHLRARLGPWFRQGLSGLFSAGCQLCGAGSETDQELCAGCLHDLPWLLRPCAHCAEPLPTDDAILCARCLRRPPPFSRVLAPFVYAEPIDRLILRFKFHGDLPAGRLLAEQLVERLLDEPEPPALLLPVPLHRRRLRTRGFNQAWELTRLLSRRLNIRADPHLLSRARDTPPQHDLAEKARHGNVRGAFTLTGPLPARHIALVDDVLTTGQTAAELARVLRRAGAERVEVWVVAKTPHRQA